jgi:hypothetical protein
MASGNSNQTKTLIHHWEAFEAGARVLGVPGLAESVFGAAVPHWYPRALVVLAIPQSWAGGKLRVMELGARVGRLKQRLELKTLQKITRMNKNQFRHRAPAALVQDSRY